MFHREARRRIPGHSGFIEKVSVLRDCPAEYDLNQQDVPHCCSLTEKQVSLFPTPLVSRIFFFLSFLFFGYTVYSWTLTLSSCSVYRSLFGNVFSGPSHHFTNFPFVFSEPLAMTHFPFKLKTFSLFSTSPFVFWGKKRERNSHA